MIVLNLSSIDRLNFRVSLARAGAEVLIESASFEYREWGLEDQPFNSSLEQSAQLAFRGEIEENNGNVNDLGDLNARRFRKSFQRYREED